MEDPMFTMEAPKFSYDDMLFFDELFPETANVVGYNDLMNSDISQACMPSKDIQNFYPNNDGTELYHNHSTNKLSKYTSTFFNNVNEGTTDYISPHTSMNPVNSNYSNMGPMNGSYTSQEAHTGLKPWERIRDSFNKERPQYVSFTEGSNLAAEEMYGNYSSNQNITSINYRVGSSGQRSMVPGLIDSLPISKNACYRGIEHLSPSIQSNVAHMGTAPLVYNREVVTSENLAYVATPTSYNGSFNKTSNVDTDESNGKQDEILAERAFANYFNLDAVPEYPENDDIKIEEKDILSSSESTHVKEFGGNPSSPTVSQVYECENDSTSSKSSRSYGLGIYVRSPKVGDASHDSPSNEATRDARKFGEPIVSNTSSLHRSINGGERSRLSSPYYSQTIDHSSSGNLNSEAVKKFSMDSSGDQQENSADEYESSYTSYSSSGSTDDSCSSRLSDENHMRFRNRSVSKIPLREIYSMMGLSHDHLQAKWREERIIAIAKAEGFDVGNQTWIRDTEEHKRARIIESIRSQTREFGYPPDLIEAIVRRGTYARMQSKLRQKRRHSKRRSVSHQIAC